MNVATAQHRGHSAIGRTTCAYHPDPASGPPPPCWIAQASDRARLELAFAILRRYGIAAVPTTDQDGEGARRRVEEWLAASFPAGAGSYVLWASEDDELCFDEAGNLVRDFPLLHPRHVEAALVDALERAGLPWRNDTDDRRTVVVSVAR
ncbi:hypothetical protein [Trujillonella humicola]|uniref:hypothetical protein n=1 Tax=Trujillonella humicola TaxID=3383699 RepID=UPI003905BA5A